MAKKSRAYTRVKGQSVDSLDKIRQDSFKKIEALNPKREAALKAKDVKGYMSVLKEQKRLSLAADRVVQEQKRIGHDITAPDNQKYYVKNPNGKGVVSMSVKQIRDARGVDPVTSVTAKIGTVPAMPSSAGAPMSLQESIDQKSAIVRSARTVSEAVNGLQNGGGGGGGDDQPRDELGRWT